MTQAPLCGSCAHTNTVATIPCVTVLMPAALVECAICRAPTARWAPRDVVVALLRGRLELLGETVDASEIRPATAKDWERFRDGELE